MQVRDPEPHGSEPATDSGHELGQRTRPGLRATTIGSGSCLLLPFFVDDARRVWLRDVPDRELLLRDPDGEDVRVAMASRLRDSHISLTRNTPHLAFCTAPRESWRDGRESGPEAAMLATIRGGRQASRRG